MRISDWSSYVCSSDLLHFDTIIGTTFGLIGIATIVSTLFIGMVADRFIAAQKLLGILSLGAGGALFWVSTIQSSPSLFLFGCLLHFLFYASTIDRKSTRLNSSH